MRIIWDTSESVFVAEFSQDFTGDLDAVKTAGFRTHGAPEWKWYAASPGIKTLEKLKKSPPKSGLLISELALEKYRFLTEQDRKKQELKKLFEKGKKTAQNDQVKRPVYEKDGFISFVVEQKDTGFVSTYVRPAPPDVYCFLCGESLYLMDYPDACLWCSK